MVEDIVAEIRQLEQDIFSPDVKAVTTKLGGIQKQLELSEESMSAHLDAFRAEMAAFRAEMRSEFQAQRNLLQNDILRETLPLRERVAALEARASGTD